MVVLRRLVARRIALYPPTKQFHALCILLLHEALVIKIYRNHGPEVNVPRTRCHRASVLQPVDA